MPRGRKKTRTCTTTGCQGKITLYPQCDKCRKANCSHTETHYDGNFAKVCDRCGITVQPSLKARGKNKVGTGRKSRRAASFVAPRTPKRKDPEINFQ